MPTVIQALNAVMRDVQGVRKSDKNNAPNGGYLFRGIDAVTNAVGPALRDHGVIVVPTVLESHYESVEVGKNRSLMSRTTLRIRFTWYGPDGDSVECVTQGEAFDSGDKATAKAHSVAFRTAMLQTLCLPTDEKDPDVDTYVRSELFDMEPWQARINACQTEADLKALWDEAKEQNVHHHLKDAVTKRKAQVTP